MCGTSRKYKRKYARKNTVDKTSFIFEINDARVRLHNTQKSYLHYSLDFIDGLPHMPDV